MTRPWLPAFALLALVGPASAAGPDLTLREALARGLERNLDLKLEELAVPLRGEDEAIAEAAFDPVLTAGAEARLDQTPTASATAREEADVRRRLGADAGLRQRFATGLEGRLAFETSRASGNSASDGLDPRYRSLLVLDLTQPLLKDRGGAVNRTGVELARQGALQARYRYLDRAQRLAEEVELAYYDLARARHVLACREESARLARELLAGNRAKFGAGVVPITEVHQAETALAAREELVILARQQVESLSTRLLDLLEIRRGDPLYGPVLATEPLPPPPGAVPGPEDALAAALAERPDLRERRLEVESRDLRLAFADNQLLPRLDLVATLGLNALSGERRSGAPANVHEGEYHDALGRLPEGDGYQWAAGVRLTYPLGNRAAEARLRQAGWEKRQALTGLKRLEGAAEHQVDRARVDVGRSLERIALAERFEALAATTLAEELERLQEGLSDSFRVLDLQDKLIDARVRKVAALADAHRGLASLYRAMGQNLKRHGIVAELGDKETSRDPFR